MVNGWQQRPMSASPSLPPVMELNDGESEDVRSSSSDFDQRSVRSLPTEYGQSFRRGGNPRPRNPVHGWQARNMSNIIPILGSEPSVPRRPLRRQQPEASKRQRNQVFPEAVVAAREGGGTDANNNPEIPPVPVRGRRHRPWQARAQTSSIFSGEAGVTTTATTTGSSLEGGRPRTGYSRWPWQERAKKSVIFDLLSSKETVTPSPRARKYQWDQQKSTLNISNITSEGLPDVAPTTSPTTGGVRQWPWQERAQQSVIFRSPDKPNCPRQIKYSWDQRRSRFSTQLDPEAKFPTGSHYTENYRTWKGNQEGLTKPAGKPCYLEEDYKQESERRSSGKRRSLSKSPTSKDKKDNGNGKKPRAVIELPAPPSPEKCSPRALTLSKVTGTTCMEMVPVDYHFIN